MKPSICFIVITYNNAETIKACIESIKNQNCNQNCSLIVIDNNSEDKTLEAIKEYNKSLFRKGEHGGFLKNSSPLYKGELEGVIKIIKNKKNLGFARAVNQGIAYAKKNLNPDFYFLLNPDAYLEKNCLSNLELNSEKVIKSPIIVNPENNQPWFSGAKINWLKFKTKHHISPSYYKRGLGGVINLPTTSYKPRSSAKSRWYRDKPQATSYLTGCALSIPKEVIRKLSSCDKVRNRGVVDSPPCGKEELACPPKLQRRREGVIKIFDEKFFLYYEDADFSLRAKKAGFKLKIIPKVICYHKESASSSSEIKNYHLVKSGLVFFHKHYPKILLPYFWLVFYLRFFYHKYISKKETVLQAMLDFKKNINKKVPPNLSS